jgi:hypothetical protein
MGSINVSGTTAVSQPSRFVQVPLELRFGDVAARGLLTSPLAAAMAAARVETC